MTLLYGYRFTGQIRDPKAAAEWREDWSEVLGGLTGEQIKRGLGALEERAVARTRQNMQDSPPTAFEFRILCSPPGVPLAHRVHEFIRLPPPRGDPEVARQRIAEIKAKYLTPKDEKCHNESD